jgi:hypothetical protein
MMIAMQTSCSRFSSCHAHRAVSEALTEAHVGLCKLAHGCGPVCGVNGRSDANRHAAASAAAAQAGPHVRAEQLCTVWCKWRYSDVV